MLALINAVGAWLLVLLLVGTSPFGMGVGVHREQMLDPLVPHLHLRDGRVLPIAQSTSATDAQPAPPGVDQRGVAIGAGTAGTFDGIGTEAPALPAEALSKLNTATLYLGVLWLESPAMPRGQNYAPPDPPPLPIG